MLVKTHVGGILGGFAGDGWKPVEGNGDCLLFQLEPLVSVKRTCCTFASHHCGDHADKMPNGVGFSPDVNGEPQIFISENLDFCLVPNIDKHSHGIELLEVWATKC